MKSVACRFDKDAVWAKVRGRKPIVLDMNCWINMRDDRCPVATRMRSTLRKLVSTGAIFCPLSFALIEELYKQAEESRLKTAALMDELSLGVSYANRLEIFAWEVEQAVRRLVDAGPIDLSTHGLYVPVVAYLSSRFQLEFSEDLSPEQMSDAVEMVKKLENLTLTEILDRKDEIFAFAKKVAAPQYLEAGKEAWKAANRNKQKMQRLVGREIFELYIAPALEQLPLPVQAKAVNYFRDTSGNADGGCLDEFLTHLPAIRNHRDVLVAIAQNHTRKYKINDFFDFEVIPVPLAYAAVFVAQDKHIRHLLRVQTDILKSNTCRYCYDFTELEEWFRNVPH